MVKPGQTVLDVGINVNPVPGGVGSVTASVLAMHTIEAAETAAKKDGVPHVPVYYTHRTLPTKRIV